MDGYIGNQPEYRVPARLYIEAANANIAGMQDVLYFHDGEGDEFEPELLVIYTPNLTVEGYPLDPETVRPPADKLFRGVLSVFEKGGFKIVDRPQPGRTIVALTL